jgi:hypothetical protein
MGRALDQLDTSAVAVDCDPSLGLVKLWQFGNYTLDLLLQAIDHFISPMSISKPIYGDYSWEMKNEKPKHTISMEKWLMLECPSIS